MSSFLQYEIVPFICRIDRGNYTGGGTGTICSINAFPKGTSSRAPVTRASSISGILDPIRPDCLYPTTIDSGKKGAVNAAIKYPEKRTEQQGESGSSAREQMFSNQTSQTSLDRK